MIDIFKIALTVYSVVKTEKIMTKPWQKTDVSLECWASDGPGIGRSNLYLFYMTSYIHQQNDKPCILYVIHANILVTVGEHLESEWPEK